MFSCSSIGSDEIEYVGLLGVLGLTDDLLADDLLLNRDKTGMLERVAANISLKLSSSISSCYLQIFLSASPPIDPPRVFAILGWPSICRKDSSELLTGACFFLLPPFCFPWRGLEGIFGLGAQKSNKNSQKNW